MNMLSTQPRIKPDEARSTTSGAAAAARWSAKEEIVIEPTPPWRVLDFAELWRFRELLYFLTWRDIKVRYKQSLLGIAWALIQPLMYMVVFTIVFGRMAGVASDGVPYPLFSYSGLLLWTFFATAIAQAGNSVVTSGTLITKVYFPRLAVPFASVGAALFDFFISVSLLLLMMGYYKVFSPEQVTSVHIGFGLLLTVPILLLTIFAALGVGTLLAALNVAFRDFKHTIPFLVQLWMFATPAVYMGTVEARPADAPVAAVESAGAATGAEASSSPSTGLRHLLDLNPLTGLIKAFRAAVLGHDIAWLHLLYSAVISAAAFVGGCVYFHRVESSFADII